MITDLEPDILACEVKWALESITMNKASGGDGIPVELFQILTPAAMSPKLMMVLPLSDVTTIDGATAGHHSSRYSVLWGLGMAGIC